MEMQAKKKERKKKKAANNAGLSKARNIKTCTSRQTLTSEVDLQQSDRYTAANCAESSNGKINETRAIKSTFIEKASNNPGPDEGDTRGPTEISQITEKRCKPGRAVKQWKEELMNVFEKGDISEKPVVEVRMEGDTPYICNIKQLDKATRNIKLRTSGQTLTSDKVELQQFDPNFFSKTTIWCRVPGCHQSKERSCCKKEDLFVCEVHRKSLKDNLDKMCNERNVDTSMKYDIEDFKDYTSLIGIMENAYISLSKKNLPSDRKIFGKKSGIFQEVMLNMRNYLIAVNTLLNPVPENVSTAMENPYIIFSEIIKIARDGGEAIGRLIELVGLLRDVIKDIMYYFGIIYCWTYLQLMNNLGGQLGFGVGGALGLLGFRSGLVIGTITTAGGATFGGIGGSALYQMCYGQNDNNDDPIRRYHQQYAQKMRGAERQDDVDEGDPPQESHLYFLTGSAIGDFCLSVLKDFYNNKML